MPCELLVDERGTTFVCSRGQRRTPPCADCGRPSVALCDFPVQRPTFGVLEVATCDRAACRDHRVRVGPNLDYCIPHSLEAPVVSK